MVKRKHSILKSDYTVIRKTNNPNSKNSYVENRYPTTTSIETTINDHVLINTDESNFALYKRINTVNKHKSINSPWMSEPDSSDTQSNNDSFDNLSDNINCDSHTLRDFVYYGSATELFQGTIRNIINKFPAEILFEGNFTIIDGIKYYILDNSYNINISDTSILDDGSVDNTLRYFSLSYKLYNLLLDNSIHKICNWEVIGKVPSCSLIYNSENGAFGRTIILYPEKLQPIKIYEYYFGDSLTYLFTDKSYCNATIRPDISEYNKFINNCSIFEKFLLNKKSQPIYTVTLETPFEDEKGLFYDMKDYTWPSSNDYNPKVEGNEFEGYINSFLSLCDFYDNYYSDHAYRSLTHESLKNLDWTFTRYAGLDVEDLSNIDSSRIEVIDRIYGRLYDELKLKISAIENQNNITYSGDKSMLNETLKESLNLKGFDFNLPKITKDNLIKTMPLYEGVYDGYCSDDADVQFTRNLIINSTYINSLKGTRFGLLTILSMFGYGQDECEVNENVIVANGNTTLSKSTEITYPLVDEIMDFNLKKDTIKFSKDSDDVDIFEGLPLNIVTIDRDDETISYAIPWYIKGRKYDGDLYFQMMGGWAKSHKILVNTDLAPNLKEIYPYNDLIFYGESEPVITYVYNIDDLIDAHLKLPIKGSIYYVSNIDDINTKYNFDMTGHYDEYYNIVSGDNASHYFILENAGYSSFIGYSVNSITYGWRNILKTEYENAVKDSDLTPAGRRLIYFDSIKENNIGNNPHIGHGLYDDGQEYIDYMAQPFKWSLENNNFSSLTCKEIERVEDIRFDIEKVTDNRKCWYFSDINHIDDRLYVYSDNKYIVNSPVNIGKYANNNFEENSMDYLGSSELNAYNPEGGKNNDEAAANSIINIKNIEIIIKPKKFATETQEFFINVVLPYVYYMIPSSSICEIKFE